MQPFLQLPKIVVGMSYGIPFGLLLVDNLALGIPIGSLIGLVIGAGMDANAKKGVSKPVSV